MYSWEKKHAAGIGWPLVVHALEGGAQEEIDLLHLRSASPSTHFISQKMRIDYF